MADFSLDFDIEKYQVIVEKIDPIKYEGKITRVTGLLVESKGPNAVIGEVCKIKLSSGKTISGEVVGLEKDRVKIVCYDEMEGIEVGNRVTATGEPLSVFVGEHLLGRVLDGLGKDYDGLGGLGCKEIYSIFNEPSDAMNRLNIVKPMPTGIKAIDGLITVGKGQRIGIFSGSGVGKSTLLGMIARNTVSDINVIALIGERARELKEFIEYDLGEEGLKKSVIVYASSNKNALCRVRGAFVATTIAEYFRDQGKDVILMMDSLTRFALAQREIGLAAGEPPTSRGYTPSVFSLLPKLLERAGTNEVGSITGFYSVLVEGDDMDEPISDAVRGILDGHIVLSRKLAYMNHYPAIDVLSSISRLMIKVTKKDHYEKANLIRELIAEYQDKEDLISIGAYATGTNPKTDLAILLKEKIDDFLTQNIDEAFDYEEVLHLIDTIIESVNGRSEEGNEEDLF